MKDKYITERERYQIEALYKQGCKPKEIAQLLGRCLATIYNELKRGMTKQLHSDLTEYEIYLADVAQEKANYNATNKGRELKIGNDYAYAEYVTGLLRDEKYSPYAVVEHIKNSDIHFETDVCKNTLYNYIKIGLFEGVSMDTLPCPRKSQNKGTTKRKVALNNSVCKSIEDRDKAIKNREEYGHWEMDTVVSARPGKAAILVLTERLTREEITAKLPDKSAASVVQALDNLEREWGDKFPLVFQTITVDNGSEFADCPSMERSALGDGSRTKLYYCHPYSSYERGSNENLNKMIRRWLPKGTNFDEIADEVIEAVTVWINNYPRKILGYMTADRLFQAHLSAILGAA